MNNAWIGAKQAWNDSNKVLTGFSYFGADWSYNMAASRGLNLRKDLLGNAFKNIFLEDHRID